MHDRQVYLAGANENWNYVVDQMNAFALTRYLHPKTNEFTQNRTLTEGSEVLQDIFHTSSFHLFLCQSENKAKNP